MKSVLVVDDDPDIRELITWKLTQAGYATVVASDGEGRRYPVFKLDGTPAGDLDAPYGTNIPHPQLVPDPAGGSLMITFDGTAHH